MKAGRTMVGGAAGKGISDFAEAWVVRERSCGKIKQPVVLPDLRVEAQCGKEAFLLT